MAFFFHFHWGIWAKTVDVVSTVAMVSTYVVIFGTEPPAWAYITGATHPEFGLGINANHAIPPTRFCHVSTFQAPDCLNNIKTYQPHDTDRVFTIS